MASGNTASLQTNLNIDPYYDDFDETKNFHRLLFRPGLAVQARELTQMQTVLQNQIDRFAEHVFKEGSVVRGLDFKYDPKYNYVKIRDNDSSGSSVNAAAFVNTTITGASSGVTAYVLKTLDGAEANTPHTKTLYVKYTSGGSNNTTGAFTAGEKITANSGISANLLSSSATGIGAGVEIGEGVIYAKDHFIRVAPQKVVVGKYSTNVTARIGFEVTESIVDSDSDSTLLDPAQGAYNFAAPGANRLKLNPILTWKNTTDTSTTDFIDLARVQNGILQSASDKPQYSIINDYLAQRTFEESGNYVVDGFSIRLREHLLSGNNKGVFTAANGGNTNQLSVDVEPGKAYIQGYRVEKLTTSHVAVDKGTDYQSLTDVLIPANYGNYVTVNELAGTWDINGHDPVSLRDTAANAVSNNDFSSVSAPGAEIGTARVKAMVHSSGNPGDPRAQYKMYLYDIRMTSNTFSQVRSVYMNNATGIADGKADTVLVSGNTSIQEPSFNRSIFKIPANNIRKLRDTSNNIDTDFEFMKTFTASVATDGTFSVATGSADETFPFSAGALNATQKDGNFFVSFNSQANTANLTGTVSVTSGSNLVTGSGTSFDSELNVGDIINAGNTGDLVISAINTSTNLSIYSTSGTTFTGGNYFKKFKPGSVVDMAGNGSDGSTRTITVASGLLSSDFDIQETLTSTANVSVITNLNKANGQEIAKNYLSSRYVQIRISDNSAGTTGPWNLGLSDIHKIQTVRQKTGNAVFTTTSEGTDVTSHFELDTGQKDNFYDHGKLKKKSSSGLLIANGQVYLVKLDYFTHDTSSGKGYFSVDSYPIDDTNTSNTTAITTQEIPIFVSPVDGKRFSLRDCIDLRPRIADTANNATTVGTSSVNPATSTTIVEPSGGIHYAVPNQNFDIDLDYYLKRKDRVVLDLNNRFRVIKGQPSLFPVTPEEPTGTMTLAKVDIAPYPTLSPELGRQYSRPDLTAAITPVRNERYTMRNIGGLRDRIDRLEYYTALSLLEKDAQQRLIQDSSGVDRFKNGIIVDPFLGHKIGNVFDPDYKISIDPLKGEARPSFNITNQDLFHHSANSTNIYRNAKDVSLVISSNTTFTNNETVTSGGASGTLRYQVANTLYVEAISGTFTAGANVTGGTSSKSSEIASVTTPSPGDLALLPYTHELVFQQPWASTTRNAAGLIYSFTGSLQMIPDTDFWTDTTTQPDVQINYDLSQDNILEMRNQIQTLWQNWRTQWTGIEDPNQRNINEGQNVIGTQNVDGFQTVATLTTDQNQTRRGIFVVTAPESRQQTAGNSRVVDVNIIPFMRSRVIGIVGRSFKPSTKLYAFFDDTDVSSYITPANSSLANTATEGATLTSDSNGDVYGLFRLPNDDTLKFRVGEKQFVLTDSPTNSTDFGLVTTRGQTTYSASGLSQFTSATRPVTIVNNTFVTRVTNIVGAGNQDEGWNGGDGGDPIAQTFLVDDLLTSRVQGPGVFITKVDLFFATKSSTFPVILEIRELDESLGFITNRIVPFGKKVVESSAVNVSTDGSAPTPFVFDSPVFLKNNTYYALVVKPGGNNPDYAVWIARMGENDLVSGNRISKNAYQSGKMFASSNDRGYAPLDGEDMKFSVYVANFTPGTTGNIIMKNDDRDYFVVANVSANFSTVGEAIHGETTLTLTSQPSVNTTLYVSGGTSLANGILSSISSNTATVKDVTTAYKYSTGETVTFYHANGLTTGVTSTIHSQSTPTGKLALYDTVNASNTLLEVANTSGAFTQNTFIKGQQTSATARIVTIDDKRVDTIHLQTGLMSFPNTSIKFQGIFATSNTAKETTFFDLNVNDDTDFETSRYALSKSTETNNLSSKKSVEVKGILTTNTRRLSPVVDLKRSGIILIGNKINNDSTGETGNGGNASAKYITRRVTLADGQEAEDLKVYLDAYKPSGSSIEVYYKILHEEDSTDFNDAAWTQMTQVTSSTTTSDSENTEDFKEFEYTIPTAKLTGTNGEVQYTNSDSVTFTGFKYFAIKVVLLKSSTTRPPRIRDFRCIALQI